MIIMPIMPQCLSWEFVYYLCCIFLFSSPPPLFLSHTSTPAKWLNVECTFCLHVVLTYTVYVGCVYVKAQAEVILTAFGLCGCEARTGSTLQAVWKVYNDIPLM